MMKMKKKTYTSLTNPEFLDSGFQKSLENSEQHPGERRKILNEIYETEKTYNHQLTRDGHLDETIDFVQFRFIR